MIALLRDCRLIFRFGRVRVCDRAVEPCWGWQAFSRVAQCDFLPVVTEIASPLHSLAGYLDAAANAWIRIPSNYPNGSARSFQPRVPVPESEAYVLCQQLLTDPNGAKFLWSLQGKNLVHRMDGAFRCCYYTWIASHFPFFLLFLLVKRFQVLFSRYRELRSLDRLLTLSQLSNKSRAVL